MKKRSWRVHYTLLYWREEEVVEAQDEARAREALLAKYPGIKDFGRITEVVPA